VEMNENERHPGSDWLARRSFDREFRAANG